MIDATWLARVFASAVVRRIAVVVVSVILASIFGMGRAHAASYDPSTCSSAGQNCTKQQAYAVCLNNITWYSSPPNAVQPNPRCETPNTGNASIGQWTGKFDGGQFGATYWGVACPAPSTWDEPSKTCKTGCPDGYSPDPANPGQCMNREKCESLNGQNGFNPNEERAYRHAKNSASNSYCPASGCEFVRTGQIGGTTCAGGECITYGSWNYSGNACSTTTGDPLFKPPVPQDITDPTKPKECVAAGDGLTFCRKADGRQCHTASTGKEICWGVGETGTKTSDDVLQKRDAGSTDIPPNLNLPNGDTLIKQTPPPVTVTTTTNENPPKTTTTTTTNYFTQFGTNAAPDGGKGSGTSTTGTDGEGEGEGDNPTATGGTDCTTPPVVSGDPVGGLIATMQWKARCAVEGNNPEGETGNIADCAAPWSVTGTDKQVNKARALRATLCPNNPAETDYLGDGTGEGEGGHEEVNGDLLPNGFDESGFGWGSTCPIIPTVSVMGKSIDLNTGPFCDWMHLGGWFVLLMAGMACLRMLTEAA